MKLSILFFLIFLVVSSKVTLASTPSKIYWESATFSTIAPIYGKIKVDVSMQKADEGNLKQAKKIQSIILDVDGKQYAIPNSVFNDLNYPLINTFQIEIEKGSILDALVLIFEFNHRYIDGELLKDRASIVIDRGELELRIINSQYNKNSFQTYYDCYGKNERYQFLCTKHPSPKNKSF